MIREADSRRDLERCVEICNAVDPESPVHVGQFSLDRGTTLMHEGRGYAFIVRSSVVDNAYAMVRVHPEARRRGIGSALLRAARERTRALGLGSLWGRVRDEESLAFVTSRGFEELTREVNVVREVRVGDGEVAPGIAKLGERHLREAYDVCAACIPEIHVPLAGEVRPYAEWVEEEGRNSPVAFVALDGGKVVGYARLYRTAVPHRLEHGLTAVHRSHRRRGIATALKRAQIKWAADRGYSELVTDMVEGNAGMRAVNERLGYVPLPPVIVVGGRAS